MNPSSQAPAKPQAAADDHPHANYLAVFGALCALTLVSVGFDLLPNPPKLVLAALVFGVATAKAYCVMAWFMHLKFEGAWKYIVLVPTSLLGLGLVLALLPDIGIHYYTVEADSDVTAVGPVENPPGTGVELNETGAGE
ncbi:cytochrome C oxidase subunit IV family protein [Alienimonas chondri]|uniref:Caa(3)-type oxidase subunit IV n=1 Tax=Alienimonas chondri TaxID=2681879 RepID=A0ABX1VDL9_9PLAN|nr:cytochrome C oxidase subunit IV family protein [Alienimonas chondri]NNJ26188.1 hypothetical protein [Alienimonas chondri]